MFNPVKFILNTKMRNKMIFMCICVIVPVFSAGVYLIINTNGILQDNIIKQGYNDAENLANRLKDTIFTTISISERVYSDPDLQYLINDNFDSALDYREFYDNNNIIDEYLDAYPQFENITFYLDIDGFLYNNNFKKVTPVVADSYWYSSADSAHEQKWYVIKNPDNESLNLSLVRAVYNSDGEFTGVMVFSLNTGWIETLMKDEIFDVVFSVHDNIVFYSNIPGITIGNVIPNNNIRFYPGTSDTFEIFDNNILTQRGNAIVSYFDYENTSNIFQIYLVKPFSMIYESTENITVIYVWYMSLCAILSVLFTILFSSMFSRRIHFLKNEMHNVANGNFKLEKKIKGSDEIFDLYSDLQQMVDSIQMLIKVAYEAKIQSESFKSDQLEAEFKALASQINPHFLYNTLETIRMKAYFNGDKETAGLVKKLGKFMRRCLEVKDETVTLESELEFTNSYLELQKARFGERVTYSIYCEVDRNYRILPLIIQPIAENAFVHGVEGVKSNGNIKIRVYYKNDNVVIDVSDNGQGITDEKLAVLRNRLIKNDTSSGKNIGLTNVNKRIKMYHGEAYGITVKSTEGKGTLVSVTLPRDVSDKLAFKNNADNIVG